MSVLVTGGAGYIGAHIVHVLVEAGRDVVVADDLSTGSPDRIGDVPLMHVDLSTDAATDQLEGAIRSHGVDAVVHVAAKKQVGESMQRPAWYYRQNVGGMANLLEAIARTGVERVVFSSSAAVYGVPERTIVDETVEPRPINPYGATKLVGEWMLADAARATGLSHASLRYFNVAGAGRPDLGDPEALNLVTIVLDRMARGLRPLVYGDHHPTPDGTGVRDYVHVLDLAEAHLAALEHLDAPDRMHDVFNVGTGSGASVLEVIARISAERGTELEPEIVPARAGDPAQLVADPGRIETDLGWRATRGLDEIIASACEADLARRTRSRD
ncbi:UDP-glucose 4-epimerase GalE [Agromyces binzhouensis]|uniref:UDP-glucose 4-epimerase GalE n=1 Tax=Agromyces binzhouensis TaxID=1817495 RepID=UPI00362DFF67